MAAKKKAKKAASNPARGFATTSIASKPVSREDLVVVDAKLAPTTPAKVAGSAAGPEEKAAVPTPAAAAAGKGIQKTDLTAEEFEAHLEQSELQFLVEKYAAKVKRDAHRQSSRLDKDRRLLRQQADPINCPKWLPQDIVANILGLIEAESRYSTSTVSSEAPSAGAGKLPLEEDLTMRLWTLRLVLQDLGLPQERANATIDHVLRISPNISGNVSKDSIWGLDEAFEYMAKECPPEELLPYDVRPRQLPSADTPTDNPDDNGEQSKAPPSQKRSTKVVVGCDSDIEPEDLTPEFLKAKSRILELERGLGGEKDQELELGKLKAKVARIENDVLFDGARAEAEWRSCRVALEKEFAAAKRLEAAADQQVNNGAGHSRQSDTSQKGGQVNAEAEKLAADLLMENEDDDDDGISGLFSSLPVEEVDEATGRTNAVINGADGSRVVIRDFAKWSGVNPVRILEEACRARDSSVKISYRSVSETSFANRHSVTIQWSKAQELATDAMAPGMHVLASPVKATFTMVGVATPDKSKSEAMIATYALFHLVSSSSSAKEDKLSFRLPPIWRELYGEYAQIRKDELDEADRQVIKELRDLVRQRLDQDLEEGAVLPGFRTKVAARNQTDGNETNSPSQSRQPALTGDGLRQIWAEKSSTPRYQTMLKYRRQLPMWSFKQHVVQAIDSHQVVIVCGETGCGKSTQLPSFILEHELSQGRHCKIYCTEPRRISAVSLARRVSEELGERRGDLGTSRSLIGYSIRLEAKASRETRLVYATTGIVMRMLEGSNDLSEATHLVLDEVHERTIDSDFLLIVLKKLMKKRNDLKVVLMSATVDANRFSAYLDGAPVLNVPGRTFPVTTKFLEDAVELTGYTGADEPRVRMVDLDDDAADPAEGEAEGAKSRLMAELSTSNYSSRTRAALAKMDEYRIDFDLVMELIKKIATDPAHGAYSKAILVFLPGMAEIRSLNDMLLGNPDFASSWLVYPLHSSIATEEQEAAFLVPPPGTRKIVLATNIAETGITIPDVTCVIDAGKHKEMRFDERRQLSRLIDSFISRANAKQRRGRAGRVQEGLCFHLFTKYRHDKIMSDQQTPEMLRLSLQDLAIRVKICRIGGIEETLSEALDPPLARNIRRAVDSLIDVRALTTGEDLTPLGRQLARLPLDVFLGKLILLGTIFKCLDMALTVAALLSSKSPFSAPFGQRKQADVARQAFRRADSDLLTVYNAYLAWKRCCRSTGSQFEFCRRNYLNPQTLGNIEEIKGQLLVSVVDSGFLQVTEDERRALKGMRFSSGRGRKQQHFFEVPQRVNINSETDQVAMSILAWSFYPKLLVRDPPGSRSLRNIGNNQSISLHPSSVNKARLELRWLSYYNIMQSKQVYHAHETTAVDGFAIALLCGDVRFDMFSGVMILDGNRARFVVPDWKTMLVIKVLRSRLRDVLSRTFKQPDKLPSLQQEKWLDVWQAIFTLDAKDQAATN